MTRIEEVAVVVPARDEEELLPGCLEALAVAVTRSPVPVRTIVVLDDCRDGSAAVCARYDVETLTVGYGNVGRVRAAGIRRAVRSEARPEARWIANTDADSRVAPDWIEEQVRLADEGADAVLGVANVSFGSPVDVLRAHQRGYRQGLRQDGSHAHVHGANFGIRASTYLDAGGFLPLPDHEDRQLLLRLRAMRYPVVVATTTLVVDTSGRAAGRCTEGVARTMARLAADTPLEEVGRPA